MGPASARAPGNPWFTRSIAAPVGAQLGLHALMPLPDALMTPVSLAFGPSASHNLLSIAMPGLLGYATYRVARLWLPSQISAIAAGAFLGLSSMLVWRSWYQLNLAAGDLFLPLALEAVVRLTGRPGQGSRADPEPFSCHLAGDLLDRAVSGQERSERRSVTRRCGSAGSWRGTGELAGSSGRHSMTTS